jgi:hypothetical protein
MCFCLLTLVHFKVVPSRGWDDCSACVKPLSFQGKPRYAFTYYQYLSPACSTSISECTRGGTIYYKGKLTGLTGSCKNKGTIGQIVCWQKDRDPLKAWNDEMTGGGNKPQYVWASSPTTLSPHQSTKGKAADSERPSKDNYLDSYEPVKDINMPPPRPPLRLPSRTENLNLEPQLYRLLNATHRLLNLTNPPLAGDCWLCLSSGPLHYVAAPVSPLNQSVHDATPNCTSTNPKVSNMQLPQKAPNCIYNSRGSYPVGDLAASQCAQIQNCTTTAIRCTVDRPWCSSPGTFFVCGTLAYQCLPANWKGICTLASLTPQINIVPNNQTLPVPLTAHTRRKRAIQFIPLLIGLGVTAGTGTGTGGIASSASYADLTSDIKQLARSIVAMQDQPASLGSAVLQNQRGLGLLTAKNGGLCHFLNEECCFYVNQLGIVRDMAQQLLDRVARRRQELAIPGTDGVTSGIGPHGFSPWLVLFSCSFWPSYLALASSIHYSLH